MKLYLIRHGESETNLLHQWTGWLDVSLTDKGKADAKRAGALLAPVSFDKIYASDLQRARHTAELALPGTIYETTPLLREINVGTLAGRPSDCIDEATRQRGFRSGYAEFEGESTAQMRARVRDFMHIVEGLNCQYVAAFSHAGFLLHFLSEALGADLTRKIICNNCAIAVFDFSERGWRLHSWINHT